MINKQQETSTIVNKARLLDPNWVYIPASQTDVLKRFKQMGWIPPSEVKNASTTS